MTIQSWLLLRGGSFNSHCALDSKYSHWTSNIHTGHQIFTLNIKYSHWTSNSHTGHQIFTLTIKYSHWTPTIHTGHQIFILDTKYSHWTSNINIGHQIFTLDIKYIHWTPNIHTGHQAPARLEGLTKDGNFCVCYRISKMASSDKYKQSDVGSKRTIDVASSFNSTI